MNGDSTAPPARGMEREPGAGSSATIVRDEPIVHDEAMLRDDVIVRDDVVIAPSDQTVISKRPLAAAPPVAPLALKPKDLGAALIGQQLDHFVLEEFVGGGGMGAVFRGTDLKLGRTVAVKVISGEHTDEDTLKRFRNEAQSTARLDHPNIARVYHVGEDRGWSYIVFEFIEGINVRDLVVRDGPLSCADAVNFTLQVAEALGHAALRDVVHRDIKPSNILVMADGRVKLVDMGLARLHQVDSPSNDLTETGVTLGTFDYISPEQARDPRSADARSDLYSLGCTLYFMLTGQPPFPGGTVLQKLLAHSSEPAPDPRMLRTDLPPALCRIVMRMMEKQPARRQQNSAELIAELLQACQDLGIPGVAHLVETWNKPAPAGGVWRSVLLTWLIPVVGLAIVVAIASEPWRARGARAIRPARPPALPKRIATALPAAALPPIEPTAAGPRSAATSAGARAATANAVAPAAGEEPSANAVAANASADDGAAANPAPTTAYVPTAIEAAAPPLAIAAGPADVFADAGSSSGATSPDQALVANTGSGVAGGPAVAAAEPTRIVVAADGDVAGGVPVARTLAAAFQQAMTAKQVQVIELRCNERIEQPFFWQLNRAITVEAAPGFQPVITFQPPVADIARERRMMHVLGGRTTFRGVRFRLEAPASPADGWALFYLDQIRSINFEDCAFTVVNYGNSPTTFFEISPPPKPSSMMPTETAPPIDRPSLVLQRCLAKGQGDVVKAVEGLTFQLGWHEGFVAVTGRLANIGGWASPEVPEVALLDLRNMTVIARGGLVRVSPPTGLIVPKLDLHCRNSILIHDDAAPLIEHVAVEMADRAVSRTHHHGELNAYPATKTAWRIETRDGAVVTYAWGEQPERAYEEQSAERYVPWKSGVEPTIGDSLDALRPEDFVVDESDLFQIGCRPELLPRPD